MRQALLFSKRKWETEAQPGAEGCQWWAGGEPRLDPKSPCFRRIIILLEQWLSGILKAFWGQMVWKRKYSLKDLERVT